MVLIYSHFLLGGGQWVKFFHLMSPLHDLELVQLCSEIALELTTFLVHQESKLPDQVLLGLRDVGEVAKPLRHAKVIICTIWPLHLSRFQYLNSKETIGYF